MAVKSEIVRPQAGETVGVGTNRVFGVAWAGQEAVSRVEISTTAARPGATPNCSPECAIFMDALGIPVGGGVARHLLAARAGHQCFGPRPTAGHDPLLGGYQIHFTRPRAVVVESRTRGPARFSDADTLVYDMNAFAEENSRRPLDVELAVSEGAGI